jgi:hypothetical protein
VFFKVQNGALTQRDVKNEDRTDYVYENTWNNDKMSGQKTGFYTKMHQLREVQRESVGLTGRKCKGYSIKRDDRRQTVDGKRGKQWLQVTSGKHENAGFQEMGRRRILAVRSFRPAWTTITAGAEFQMGRRARGCR